jgi:hypothetical protein
VCPIDTTPEEWQGFLRDVAGRLTESCRAVDPQSTDAAIEHAHDADVVEGEKAAEVPAVVPEATPAVAFGAGVFDD